MIIITATPEGQFCTNGNRKNWPAVHACSWKTERTFCGIRLSYNWIFHQMASNYPQAEVNCKRCLGTRKWRLLNV